MVAVVAVVAGPTLLSASGPTGGHPTAYDVLVALHVISAVIGFGAVAITGAYGAIARQASSRPDAAEEIRRYFSSGSWLEYLVLVAPLFGVVAMTVRPGGQEFGQMWAVAGVVIWLAAGGILTAVVRPAERRIRAAAAGPEPDRPEPDRPEPDRPEPDRPEPDRPEPAGPDRPESDAAPSVVTPGRRLMWASAASDVLFVIALLLMVTQPR